MGSQQLTLNQLRSLAEYFRMQTKLVIFTLLVCFLVGCYAPFPRSDFRSIFNPLIEPWWCRISRGMREFLHQTFAGGPLNERGPCTVPEGSMKRDKKLQPKNFFN